MTYGKGLASLSCRSLTGLLKSELHKSPLFRWKASPQSAPIASIPLFFLPRRYRSLNTKKEAFISSLFIWEPPDVGLAPTGVWRVPPPIPHCNWRTLPSRQSSSLPTLSLPLPPTPLALFAMLRSPGQGGPVWCGGRGSGGGVDGGGPSSGTWSQTHIWGYSIHSQRFNIR